eukprot:scaffold7067_cov245-Pinguiococcus_pyrenoidosus.AAC.18
MRALLHDGALVEHDDLIRVLDRAQPMRDHQAGAILAQAIESRLHALLGARVQRGCRLVEEDHRRILQQATSNRNPLLLAAAELQEISDKLEDLCALRRGLDLFVRGVQLAIHDVVPDRVIEEHRVLRDHADLVAEALLGNVANVLSVQPDRTGGRIVKSKEQPADRGLPRARGADDGRGRARRNPEGDVPDAPVVLLVDEGDVLERQAQAGVRGIEGHLRQRLGVRGVEDVRLLGEELAQVLQIDPRCDDRVVDRPEEVQRREEIENPGVHRDEIADVHGAILNRDRTEDEGSDQAGVQNQLLRDVQRGEARQDLHVEGLVVVHGVEEALDLIALVGEVLDGLVVHQRVGELVVPLVVRFVHPAPELLPPERELDRDDGIHEHRHEAEHGQGPVVEVRQEEDAHGEGLEDRGPQVQHSIAHERVAGRDATVRDADNFPQLLLQVPSETEAVHVIEGVLRQVHKRGLGNPQVGEALPLLESLAKEEQGPEDRNLPDSRARVSVVHMVGRVGQEDRRDDVAHLRGADAKPREHDEDAAPDASRPEVRLQGLQYLQSAQLLLLLVLARSRLFILAQQPMASRGGRDHRRRRPRPAEEGGLDEAESHEQGVEAAGAQILRVRIEQYFVGGQEISWRAKEKAEQAHDEQKHLHVQHGLAKAVRIKTIEPNRHSHHLSIPTDSRALDHHETLQHVSTKASYHESGAREDFYAEKKRRKLPEMPSHLSRPLDIGRFTRSAQLWSVHPPPRAHRDYAGEKGQRRRNGRTRDSARSGWQARHGFQKKTRPKS